MYLIVNVGSTGTGKSTFINDHIVNKGEKCFIYDFQGEYKDVPILENRLKKQIRVIGRNCDIEDYMDVVKQLQHKYYTCIIEEATGVFSSSRNKEFTRLILSKRHDNITYILNFHSLNAIPPSIAEFADVIILRKTGDDPAKVKKKFPRLLKTWVNLINDPNKYAKKIINSSNLTQ